MNRLQGSLITEIFGAKVPKKSDLGFPWDQCSRFGFTQLIFSGPLILAVHPASVSPRQPQALYISRQTVNS